MDAKEILGKIRQLFADANAAPAQAAAAPAPAATSEVTLKDGSKVMIDKVEIGGTVTLADGTPVPAGEYELQDGTKITVQDNGIIAEVASATEEGTDPATDMLKMKTELEKFANSTTTPDLQKMAVILKACFENVFGWQIREAQDKLTRDAAIEAYKTGFSAENNPFSEKFTQYDAKFADYEGRFAQYEERFGQYEAKMAKVMELNEQLLKLATHLVERPAAGADTGASAASAFSAEDETGKIVKKAEALFAACEKNK